MFDGYPAIKLTVARKMTERIDMRAYMSAESDGIGGGGSSVAVDDVAVPLRQAVEEWRMSGEMWHAREIRLAEVVRTNV